MTDRSSENLQPRQPQKRITGKLWPWLLFLCFSVAGVLVAVQINGAENTTDDNFGAVETSSKEPMADNALQAPQDAAAKPAAVDDLTGRLASMISADAVENANHPLEPMLKLAQEGLQRIDQNVAGYTATIISQVQTGGVLQPERQIFCKIRHASTKTAASSPMTVDGKLPDSPQPAPGAVPFSVYLAMREPSSVAGQEVIWVDGQNQNKLIAHAAGMLNLKRVYLEPTGALAMKDSRHPIYRIGFRNLISKMQEVGNRDLQYDDCIVDVTRDVAVHGRTCTLVQIKHEHQQPHFEYHIAKIFIDQQMDVLLGYEGYDWPQKVGDPPVLLERYFYADLKLNVGLTEEDFSPANKDYHFPSW